MSKRTELLVMAVILENMNMSTSMITKRTAFLFLILFIFLITFHTTAATIVAASSSYADVNTAVNVTAARGDTVTVPAGGGTVTWGSTLVITKGVILQGPGRDSLVVTRAGKAVSIQPDATAIANEERIEVSGFTFDGNNSALNIIEVVGAGISAAKPFKNLVIGSNRLKNSGTVTSGSGAVSVTGQVRGVIYGNIFDRVNVVAKILGNDSTNEWKNSAYFPFAYGTVDNLFFESNSVTYSSAFSGADPGWTEIGQSGRFVIRYCNWEMDNAANATELFDIHGFQNWPGGMPGQTGTMLVEYYGNTIHIAHAGRLYNHRGSWGLYFNNILTGTTPFYFNMSQYDADDIGGSGMTADVPGAAGFYMTEITNTYVWNVTGNGTAIDAGQDNIGVGSVFENQNWRNYNPSFGNNTDGIGRGTAAPVSTGNSNGAAYWKCSTPTPTVDPVITQSGHLYKMISGAWVDYYTPFTYPHPLYAGGGGGGGGGTVTNITVKGKVNGRGKGKLR